MELNDTSVDNINFICMILKKSPRISQTIP